MSDRTAVAEVAQPNGVEPVERAGMTAPGAAKPEKTISVSALRERVEKLMQGLSNMRNERDGLEQRLKEITEGISRTEGAIIGLNQARQEAGEELGGPG